MKPLGKWSNTTGPFKHPSHLRTGVLLLLLLPLVQTACLCPSLDFLLDPPTAVETVSGDWIHVLFTIPRYPDDDAYHVGGLDEEFAAVIDQAQSQVDVVAYELDLPRVSEALLAAHRDGVTVRVVVESDNLDQEENRALLNELRRAGVSVVEDERTSGLMHDKFAIIDEAWVWTGSWNMTENGAYRNNNHAVLITSPAIAENYVAEFEEMFAGKFGPTSPADTPHPIVTVQVDDPSAGPPRQVVVETYFAPEDGVAAEVIAEIEQAQHRIRFLAFIFTSELIADAMLERAQAGVVVQGVIEARNAENSYSQYDRLRRAVHDVLPDGNPYIMHHKVIIIDDETVILGSYNWTASAETRNDENLLIIHDPEVAALFVTEFGRIYEQARIAQE